MGGDKTYKQTNYTVSVDNMPTLLPNNPLSFYQGGAQNPVMTHVYFTNLNSTNVVVQSSYYNSTTTTAMTTVNPWAADVPLVGTDGSQFAPNLENNTI